MARLKQTALACLLLAAVALPAASGDNRPCDRDGDGRIDARENTLLDKDLPDCSVG